MADTPVLPALQRSVPEIIIVLLAPLTDEPVPPPKNLSEALAWTLDLVTIASANTLRSYIAHHLGLDPRQSTDTLSHKHFIDFGDTRSQVISDLIHELECDRLHSSNANNVFLIA